MFGQQKVAALVAELLGSFVITASVLAMILAPSFVTGTYQIASVGAAALTLVVLMMGDALTGYANPVVTLGLWTLRKLDTMRSVVFIAAQFSGAALALLFVTKLVGNPPTSMVKGGFEWTPFIAETVGTLVFTFGVTSALYQNLGGLRRAVTIGGSFGLGILIASFGSNALLNPALAFGARSWTFAYSTGPILGAVLGMNLYALLFVPQLVTRPTKTVTVSRSAAKTPKTTAKKVAKKKSTRR